MQSASGALPCAAASSSITEAVTITAAVSWHCGPPDVLPEEGLVNRLTSLKADLNQYVLKPAGIDGSCDWVSWLLA
jgi:hypothetical protein